MKKHTLEKGISLIETVIYVAIFSIFVIGLARFSVTLTSSRLHAQAVFEVNEQGAHVIKFITQALRNGRGINTPSVGSSASTLSIATDIPSTNPTVFSLNSGVLYVAEGSGPQVALTNNKISVSNLNFINLSRPATPNIIKVNFTVTNVHANDPYSVNFTSSGALRK